MYQIKFLKPLTLNQGSLLPKNPKKNQRNVAASYEISSAITISNDLGEQFFYGRATLACQLRLYDSDEMKNVETKYTPIAITTVEWTAGKRAMDVKLEIPSKYLQPGKYIALNVSVDSTKQAVDEMNVSDITHDELREEWFPEWKKIVGDCVESIDISSTNLQIFPTTSSLLKISNEVPVKSERFAIRSISDVVLYEELSGEIARHLWDAGIIVNNLSKPQFEKFLYRNETSPKGTNLQILELGTGIGLVAIHLSKMFRDSEFLATDLPDAKEICTMNIGLNEVQEQVKFSELDWEDDVPALKQWDIIITTDCTYNPLYYDALIKVLKRESNKDTKIILAHKFREPITESEFFVKIQAHFHLERQMWYNAQGQSLTHIGLYSLK